MQVLPPALRYFKNWMEKGTEVAKTSLKPSPFQFFIILFGALFTLPHHWLIIIKSQFVISRSVLSLCQGREQHFPLSEENSLQEPELGLGLVPFHSLQHHVQASGLEILVFGWFTHTKEAILQSNQVHHTPREICCVPMQPLHQEPRGVCELMFIPDNGCAKKMHY